MHSCYLSSDFRYFLHLLITWLDGREYLDCRVLVLVLPCTSMEVMQVIILVFAGMKDMNISLLTAMTFFIINRSCVLAPNAVNSIMSMYQYRYDIAFHWHSSCKSYGNRQCDLLDVGVLFCILSMQVHDAIPRLILHLTRAYVSGLFCLL